MEKVNGCTSRAVSYDRSTSDLFPEMSKFQNHTNLQFHNHNEYTDEQKTVFLKIQVFFRVTGTVNCYRRFGRAKRPNLPAYSDE
jgi:hypothetical protein